MLVLSLTVGATTMRADVVNFAGSATGAFGTVTPANPFSSTATLSTLTYYGSTFNDNTSSSGFLAFGGDAKANTTNFNNFGAFNLGNGNATYTNNPFELDVTFTAPAGITGGQSSTFNAVVMGSVSSKSGGAQVTFSPSSQMYTFSNGTEAGTFTLNLNNVSVNAGQTASVTGYITSNASPVSVTPEPSSLLLLGTGLIGTATTFLRRRKLAV